MSEGISLSIVIPCFNNEKYIIDCLSSIKKSNKVELVIVNDGSTDNSLFEITNWLNSNKVEHKLINQSNKGLSAARNIGIKESSGEYVSFLDGDDFVNPSYINDIIDVIENNSVDMILFDISINIDDGLVGIGVGNLKHGDVIKVANISSGLNEINDLNDLIGIFERGQWYAWCRVYKKELIDGFCFNEGCSYEDLLLIPFITLEAKSVFYLDKPLINYRKRGGSITTTPKSNHIDDLILAIELFSNLSIKLNDYSKLSRVISSMVIDTFKLANRISRHLYGSIKYDKRQRHTLKKSLSTQLKHMKLSLRLKVKFMVISSLLERIKFFRVKKH